MVKWIKSWLTAIQSTSNASVSFWQWNATEQQLRSAKFGALHFTIPAFSQQGLIPACEAFRDWPGFDG